jgi:hypothetical protein
MLLKICGAAAGVVVITMSLLQRLSAQETAVLPVKCKYAFEDYRIYCLALKDTVLLTSVKLEGADPVWCPSSPMTSMFSQNNFTDRIYDKGEIIRINLGSRCSIHAFAVDVAGRSYHFDAN